MTRIQTHLGDGAGDGPRNQTSNDPLVVGDLVDEPRPGRRQGLRHKSKLLVDYQIIVGARNTVPGIMFMDQLTQPMKTKFLTFLVGLLGLVISSPPSSATQ